METNKCSVNQLDDLSHVIIKARNGNNTSVDDIYSNAIDKSGIQGRSRL